jgi:ribosomal protein L37AE/L43A
MPRYAPLPQDARQAALTVGRCPDCGAEPTAWRGSVHRYRCRACVAKVVGVAYRPSGPRAGGERCGPARSARSLNTNPPTKGATL